MILTLVPPVMLLLGLALGGRPEKLLGLPFHAGWLVLLALGTQWILVRAPGTMPLPLFGALLLAAHALLVGWLLLNRRLPGVKLALAGALLNVAVMAANGGLMPVTPAALEAAGIQPPALVVGQRLPSSKDVLLPAEAARLSALGDMLATRWPLPLVASLGDLGVAAGLGTLILLGMQPRLGRSRRRSAVRPGGVSTAHAAM